MEIFVKMLLVILPWGSVVSSLAISSSSYGTKSRIGIAAQSVRDVYRRASDTNPDQQTAKDPPPEPEANPANGNKTGREEPQSKLPLEITSNGKGAVQVLSNNEQCATDDSSSEPSSSSSEEEGGQQRKRTVDSRSVPRDHLRHHSAKRCRRQAESKASAATGDEKQANDKKLADDKSAAAADAANKAENEKLKRQDEEQEQEQQQEQQQQAREQKNEAKFRRDFDSPSAAGQAALETGEEEKQEAKEAKEAKTRRGDDEKADVYRREETEKNEDAAAAEVRERKDDDDDGEESEEEIAKVNRRGFASKAGGLRKQRRGFEYDPPTRRRSLKRRRDDDDDDDDRAKRYLRARRNEGDDSYRQRRYDAAGGGENFYRAEREPTGHRHDDQSSWYRGRRHPAGERGERGDRARFWRADSGGREASLGEADRTYLERKMRDDDDGGVYLERKARDDDDDGVYMERKMRDDDDGGVYLDRNMRDDDDDGEYLERKMRDDDDGGAYMERKMRDDDDGGAYLERKMRDDDDGGVYLERTMRGDDDDDGAYLERKMRYADDDDEGANSYLNQARSARHSGYEASENELLRSARDDDESKVRRLKARGVQRGAGAGGAVGDPRGRRDDDDGGKKAIRAVDEGGAAETSDAKWLRGLRSAEHRSKQGRKARLSSETSKASGASSDRKRRGGDKESLAAAAASGDFLNADAASVRGVRYVEDGVKTERAAEGKEERKKRLFGILDDYIPGRKRSVVGESELRQSKAKGRNREKRGATSSFDQSKGLLDLKSPSDPAGETGVFRESLEFDEKDRDRKRRSSSMEAGKIVDPESVHDDQKKAKMKSESEALKMSKISAKYGQAK